MNNPPDPMKPSALTTTTFTALALLAVAILPCAAQPPKAAAAEFWRNPEFVAKFLGSYGFDAEVEPRITPEEQKLFKELIDLIQNNPAAAATRLKGAITADSSAALDFTLGNIYIQLDKLKEAEHSYNAAIKKFPAFRRAFKNLGIVHVQKGDYPEAIKALARSLELGGEDGNTYGLLGYCYLNLDKYASAESAYRKAILFAPDNVDWKLGLGRSLLVQQKSREAVGLFEELIQKDPDKADYWLFQANAFLELGDSVKAANNYEIVRRMGKATGASLMVLGDIYINRDLTDLALDAYLESLAKDPQQDISRPIRCAGILNSRQAWQQSAALLDQINATYKNRITDADRLKLLRLQSQVALATGKTKDGVRILQEIIDRDPLDGEAMIILADHYAKEGEPERAELLYERAAKIREHEVNALTQHAQMLVTQGKYSKAAKLLRQAQALKPRDTVAKYLEQIEHLARVSQ